MRKKKLYVVGYDEDERRVFGDEDGAGIKTFAYPVTAHKAKKFLKAMFGPTDKVQKVIYRLVPVDPKELSKKKG